MRQRAPQWARWIASILALALTLAVASFALRPVPQPEPVPPPQDMPADPQPAPPAEPEPGTEPGLELLPVPSGQPVHLNEVIDIEPGQLRFRFVAPELAAFGFEAAEDDIAHLCGTFVLPWIEARDLAVESVVISLSERAIPFGESDPDTVQFFEGYRIEDGNCMWEQF